MPFDIFRTAHVVERVRSEIAQIFFAQFTQCMNDRLRLSHCRAGECIRLVFEPARPDMNERREPEAYSSGQQSKKQNRRGDIRNSKACLILETKRVMKPLLARQPRDR